MKKRVIHNFQNGLLPYGFFLFAFALGSESAENLLEKVSGLLKKGSGPNIARFAGQLSRLLA